MHTRAVDASCIDCMCCGKEPGLQFARAEGPFLSTRAGNISPRPGRGVPFFPEKVNAMEEGDASAFHPAVPCALLSGHPSGKVRVWGFWSKLRWYFLG